MAIAIRRPRVWACTIPRRAAVPRMPEDGTRRAPGRRDHTRCGDGTLGRVAPIRRGRVTGCRQRIPNDGELYMQRACENAARPTHPPHPVAGRRIWLSLYKQTTVTVAETISSPPPWELARRRGPPPCEPRRAQGMSSAERETAPQRPLAAGRRRVVAAGAAAAATLLEEALRPSTLMVEMPSEGCAAARWERTP
jgi:hypothetical protein